MTAAQINRIVAGATHVPGLDSEEVAKVLAIGCVMLMLVMQWIAGLRFTW